MARRWMPLVAAGALVLASCGGDDDDAGSEADATADADADADAGGDGQDTAGAPAPDEDVMTQVLDRVFGLPPSFVTDEQRSCMSGQLENFFIDDFVPEDLQLTEELAEAIDEAAVTCNADFSP